LLVVLPEAVEKLGWRIVEEQEAGIDDCGIRLRRVSSQKARREG
jgi:hypothetical protein